MSCCIIALLITLTSNRVTTQHRKTRSSPGILLSSFLSSLVHSFFLAVSLCQCARLLLQLLSRFLISMLAESSEAVWQSLCLLCTLSVSISLVLSLSKMSWWLDTFRLNAPKHYDFPWNKNIEHVPCISIETWCDCTIHTEVPLFLSSLSMHCF